MMGLHGVSKSLKVNLAMLRLILSLEDSSSRYAVFCTNYRRMACGVPRMYQCINQNGIIVQQSGRFAPVLLHNLYPAFGHKSAFSPAMPQLFQSVTPSLPPHSLHETSSYVPRIAPRGPGKTVPGTPKSMRRSKLPSFVFAQHTTGPYEEKGSDKHARHTHTVVVEWIGACLTVPLIVRVPNRTQVVRRPLRQY